ncbi:uncharacterized protein [Melopsittacus undulatus]|uniref:uncharacterized protein n=1 Tax=Melopsittacus undulatus TaxID=13146 RepID=UPI00146F1F04|nr:uncharacterized protein LOC117436753 [Melopsittacus undulatus]
MEDPGYRGKAGGVFCPSVLRAPCRDTHTTPRFPPRGLGVEVIRKLCRARGAAAPFVQRWRSRGDNPDRKNTGCDRDSAVALAPSPESAHTSGGFAGPHGNLRPRKKRGVRRTKPPGSKKPPFMGNRGCPQTHAAELPGAGRLFHQRIPREHPRQEPRSALGRHHLRGGAGRGGRCSRPGTPREAEGRARACPCPAVCSPQSPEPCADPRQLPLLRAETEEQVDARESLPQTCRV